MIVMLILIPITFLLLLVAGWAFFWAVNHDQFEDLDSASLLPLTDHAKPVAASTDGDEENLPERQP